MPTSYPLTAGNLAVRTLSGFNGEDADEGTCGLLEQRVVLCEGTVILRRLIRQDLLDNLLVVSNLSKKLVGVIRLAAEKQAEAEGHDDQASNDGGNENDT